MLAKQILVIGILFPFIEYYCFVAVRRITRNLTKGWQTTILILYVLLSIAVILSLFAFRNWATSEWPSVSIKLLVSLLMGAFFGKFLTALIMLAGDVVVVFSALSKLLFSLPERIKGKPVSGKTLTRSQFISTSALICGAAFTGGLGYGITNRYRYRLRYVPLSLEGLPGEFKSMKIVQISDIHAGSFDNPQAVSDGVEMAMRENPDLILITGDLVNYRSDEIEPYMDIFGKLKAPLGVYTILGNHDYGDYLSWPTEDEKKSDFERLKNFQQLMGWKLLLNEHVIIRHNSRDFALIGSENWSIKERFPKYGDLEKAMTGLQAIDLPLKILMTHDPSHWDARIRPGYPDINLTLSGHTHGMQMGVEIPGIKWSPAQYFYKQWAGLYRVNDQYLYVNRGFGFIGYNGRIGILPEIAVLELV